MLRERVAMKPNKFFALLVVVITLLFLKGQAFSYGYGTAGEDPLISMFKDVVSEAKKKDKDWDSIKKIVGEYKQPISNLDNYFNLKLYNKFENAVNTKDLKELINTTVNLVYLSMLEKFELIRQKEFKDHAFSKGRLALNDKYYREIFKGNVIKYDEKNGTSLNATILKLFEDMYGTIGKPGKFGMGEEPPHPDDYDRIFKEIKSALKTVFPSFEG